jgi:hypothetical protein
VKDDTKSTQDSKKNISCFVLDNKLIFGQEDILMQLEEHYSTDNWWYDVFYPKLGDDFNRLVQLVDTISIDKEAVEIVKEAIINVSNRYNVSSVRQVLYGFVISIQTVDGQNY